MRKLGVAVKYVSLVEDTYEDSETVVRCVGGLTDWDYIGICSKCRQRWSGWS